MNHALRYPPAPRLGLLSLEIPGLEQLPDAVLGYPLWPSRAILAGYSGVSSASCHRSSPLTSRFRMGL
jgi:hypothetical protein